MQQPSKLCSPTGLQAVPVKHEGQGRYTAQVCCKQAGMVTVMARLNGRVIGHPMTLPVKANTASQLQITGQHDLCCTAGAILFWHLYGDMTVWHYRTAILRKRGQRLRAVTARVAAFENACQESLAP